MSRTQSQGIDYFPLAVDFFSDTKVKILKARYGADGIAVYLYILCQIYREGYYCRANDDFIFIMSDDLSIKSDTVQQVLTFLLSRSMFNEQLFKSDAILTSDGIQERWQNAVKARAAKTPITVDKYWLLKKEQTLPFIKCTNFNYSSEKKDDNSEKKDDNSENYPQSKVKESKVKYSNNNTHTVRAHEEQFAELDIPERTESQKRFFNDFDIQIDNYSPNFGNMDFDLIYQAYVESVNFLQQHPQAKFLSWICRNYTRIIGGYYKDKVAKPKKKTNMDVLREVYEQKLAEEQGGNNGQPVD